MSITVCQVQCSGPVLIRIWRASVQQELCCFIISMTEQDIMSAATSIFEL